MAMPRVTENWDRYRYALDRGHQNFQAQAILCEQMYLGGGRQWSEDDRKILEAAGRPAYEFNSILPSVNAAIGYQIQNRMDISYRPRGGDADQEQAEIRSKIAMQIADRNRLHWKETQVFSDGLIQQRGYFDVRVRFDKNFMGTITISTEDPLDVVPDPDAKTYETDGWGDVLITRWLTLDEIEQTYGADARKQVENRQYLAENDFGDFDDSGQPRNKFGATGLGFYDCRWLDGKIERVRIIERQRWVNQISRCLFYPTTGDLKLAENITPQVLQEQLSRGAVPTKSMQRRVKWTVATSMDTIIDEWSPYDDFTIVPYFAYFRRGLTIGMVDNAIGPQQARNKGLSQFLHVLNSSANSGWITEHASITNHSDEDLEANGASTGLHLSVKAGAKWPEKIKPNQVPDGVDRIVQIASDALKDVTIPEAMRGQAGPEQSGVAIQHKQFAAQQQLALPLDNLAMTRHLMGTKLLNLMKQFYTEERVFRIVGNDMATGKPKEEKIAINQYDASTDTYINDLTEGDYDVVITEQPMQVTFDNSQFQQALELRQVGVAIPDTVMVQHSTLARKAEIVEQMQGQNTDPLMQEKVNLIKAQATKAAVDAVNTSIEAIFSATQAANQIAAMPAIAPLADQILRSGGFQDKDSPPIVPEPAALPAPGAPALPEIAKNTHPLEPANPDVGVKRGIQKADTGIGQPQ